MTKKQKTGSRVSSTGNGKRRADYTVATKYAIAVRDGKVVTGIAVRLACLRHLSDIENQEALGVFWDPVEAQYAIDFIEKYCTVEVDNEILPFRLEPFQAFIVGSIFGWFNRNGTRRFRNAYIEIGKGNGKTPLAAAVAIYGLVADGQMSPEVYFAAVTKEQASIGFRDAKLMSERSPELNRILDIGASSVLFHENNGVLRAISSEKRGLDGKRPHVAVIDELHEHPSGIVVDKMRAGTKNRRNALILRITNSGSDLESVCWKEHEYSMSILEGKIVDPAWFAYVCEIDQEDKAKKIRADDWTDPKCWIKANPGLGTILPVEYLQEQVREAQGMPSKQNIVKRLNFCIWTQQHELWIPITMWEACDQIFDLEDLAGSPCWAAMDLSDKLDLSCIIAAFKYDLEKPIEVTVGHRDENDYENEIEESLNIDFGIMLHPFFFVPEETAEQREKEDRVPYTEWIRDGFVTATPGPVIDYEAIYFAARSLQERFDLRKLAYDPRGATQLAIQLNKAGIDCVEITQGFGNMSEPSQIFEALIHAGNVKHNGNPPLRWNVQNASVKHSKDNRMIIPYKAHQRKRIDGVTAAVMAIGQAMIDDLSDQYINYQGLRSLNAN